MKSADALRDLVARVGAFERPSDWGRRLVGLTLVCLLVSLPGVVAARPVPVELRASLLLRTLAYDRNLATRAGEHVDVLVVEGSHPTDAQAMAAALQALAARVSVGGLPLNVERVTYTTSDELGARIEGGGIDVLYLSSGLESEAAAIALVAETSGVALVAADGADMPNGCAIGFTVEDDRPLIVIDRRRAEASGMDLDPSVLQVARLL